MLQSNSSINWSTVLAQDYQMDLYRSKMTGVLLDRDAAREPSKHNRPALKSFILELGHNSQHIDIKIVTMSCPCEDKTYGHAFEKIRVKTG